MPDVAHYVALLRGINVGGSNPIRMADLKACFERNGFGNVSTYIASGNVLFESSEPAATLEARLERMLGSAFNYRATVMLRSAAQIQRVVVGAPQRFGTLPDRYRYDVWFLKPPLTAAAVLKSVPTKEDVDQMWAGPGVVYTSRLIARAAQSRLTRVIGTPIYSNITIRNWNTTTTLRRLLTPV